MRRCITEREILEILAHCHSGPTGGHHSASVTGRKVYEAGFYWPSIFRDAKDYVTMCDACQKSRNISSRNKMPQNNIQVCEVFDVWGLEFMGPFTDSRGDKYILVAVDYVSKWVEAQALPTNDARVVVEFLKGLFARFGVPKALMSDRGTHFCNSQPKKALLRYGLQKNSFMELNELMELRYRAYKNTRIYKERTKKWHDSRLRGDKDFKNGDEVLLFNSRLKLHPGKLKSKWIGPFVVKTMYPYGAVEITDNDGSSFKVNGHRLKKYHDRSFNTDDNEFIELDTCDSSRDLYPVTSPSLTPHALLSMSPSTWHQRLGNPSEDVLRSLMSRQFISCNKEKSSHMCHACQLGKHERLLFASSESIVTRSFEIVHSDIWTSPIVSSGGFKYYVLFLDHYSHYLWIYPLRTKYEVFQKFLHFRSYVNNQFKYDITAFQCDHGGEFDNTNLLNLFDQNGIQVRLFCPKMSQQNGKSERMIRTINNVIHTLLLVRKLHNAMGKYVARKFCYFRDYESCPKKKCYKEKIIRTNYDSEDGGIKPRCIVLKKREK
ncbi:reverse transcriptase domain-containing protein [Tanacetum coccineum]